VLQSVRYGLHEWLWPVLSAILVYLLCFGAYSTVTVHHLTPYTTHTFGFPSFLLKTSKSKNILKVLVFCSFRILQFVLFVHMELLKYVYNRLHVGLAWTPLVPALAHIYVMFPKYVLNSLVYHIVFDVTCVICILLQNLHFICPVYIKSHSAYNNNISQTYNYLGINLKT
jgi:hypothetical protein